MEEMQLDYCSKNYFYANSLKSFSLAAKLSKLGKYNKKQKVPIQQAEQLLFLDLLEKII